MALVILLIIALIVTIVHNVDAAHGLTAHQVELDGMIDHRQNRRSPATRPVRGNISTNRAATFINETHRNVSLDRSLTNAVILYGSMSAELAGA